MILHKCVVFIYNIVVDIILQLKQLGENMWKRKILLNLSTFSAVTAVVPFFATSCVNPANNQTKKENEPEFVKYNVSINTDGKGLIAVDGQRASSYNKKIAIGRHISFSVEPIDGYTFDHWSDGIEETFRTLTIYDNLNISTIFKENLVNSPKLAFYKLSINANDGGLIYVNDKRIDFPYSTNFYYGEKVELSAKPFDGWKFDKWSDGVKDSDRTITINGITSLSARFVQIPTERPCKLDICEVNNGKVQIDGVDIITPYEYTYFEGTTIEVKAIPDSDYVFSGWDDGEVENPRTITFKNDNTFSPIFTSIYEQPFTVKLRKPENGKYRIANELFDSSFEWIYENGSEAWVEAVPNEYYKFERWSDNTTTNPKKIISGVEDLYPIFTFTKFTVKLEKPTNGHYEIDGQTVNSQFSRMYDNGQLVSIKAVPDENYKFKCWSDNTADETKLITKNTRKLYPIFVPASPATFDIVLKAPTNGHYEINGKTVNGEFSNSFNVGESVTVKAIAKDGYKFVRWSDNTTNDTKVINESVELSVSFERTETEKENNPKNNYEISPIIWDEDTIKYNTSTSAILKLLDNDKEERSVDWKINKETSQYLNAFIEKGSTHSYVTITPNNVSLDGSSEFPLVIDAYVNNQFVARKKTLINVTSLYTISDINWDGKVQVYKTSSSNITLYSNNKPLLSNVIWEIGTKTDPWLNATVDGNVVKVCPNEEAFTKANILVINAYVDNKLVATKTHLFDRIEMEKYQIHIGSKDNGYVKVTIGDQQNPIIVDKNNPLDLSDIDYNTQISLEAVPKSNKYILENWNNDSADNSQKKNIAVTKDINFVANFKELKEYSISLKANSGGTIKLNIEGKDPIIVEEKKNYTAPIYEGETISIEALPNIGYTFYAWNNQSTNSTQKTIKVANDIDITAFFKKIPGPNDEKPGSTDKKAPKPINKMTFNGQTYELADNIDPNLFATTTDNNGVNTSKIPLRNCDTPILIGGVITDNSWNKLTELTLVSVDPKVKIINDDFLSGCTNLTSVDLSGLKDVTTICSCFLADAHNLKSVILPDKSAADYKINPYGFMDNIPKTASIYCGTHLYSHLNTSPFNKKIQEQLIGTHSLEHYKILPNFTIDKPMDIFYVAKEFDLEFYDDGVKVNNNNIVWRIDYEQTSKCLKCEIDKNSKLKVTLDTTCSHLNEHCSIMIYLYDKDNSLIKNHKLNFFVMYPDGVK